MKLNSNVNVDSNTKLLLNPVYERKAISILTKALIRLIDIIGAIIGIIMLIPISFYVMIDKIKENREGPLFYTQRRIGKNGKIFNMYKLNGEPIFSEFPQFINVLFGQMTLVGPRPYMEYEKEKMGEYFNIISKVKPGLTGVYQISGKRTITFEERLDLDLNYIINESLKLNLKILLITALVTVRSDRKGQLNELVYCQVPKETLSELLLKNINAFFKRVIDIIGSIIGIILLIPITIIVGFVNFISRENGPIFFTQERIGKDGKIFKMYKFRSMIVGADEKLKDMLENDEELRKEFETNRKLKNDPRITRIGKFLRKTSLDEFPQFINVLKGEMSIVGPRAVIDDEIKLFGDKKEKFLSVKPGITGYWAANGRSNTTYEERVEMEVYYADNMSIWLDIKILFKTVIAVLKREGAV